MPVQIEHNPHEKRPGNGIWWALAVVVPALWLGYFYFNRPDWWGIALAAGSGVILTIWAMEVTENKAPDWMRSPPRR